MAGLFSLLSTARDGMFAHTSALSVTGQNVAGVSTPGYVRRTAVLESSSTGVRVTGVTRSVDRFAAAQVSEQAGRLGAAVARAGPLERLEALVAPANGSISDHIDSLLEAFHHLALEPDNLAMRSSVLAGADRLATTFSDVSEGIRGLSAELSTLAETLVEDVNGRLARVAELDRAAYEGRARGDDVSSLLDQRDQAVREVAERVGGRVVPADDGTIVLFGAGTVLYEGGRAATLSVSIGTGGALSVKKDGGGPDLVVDSGSLGGVIEARDRDLAGVATRVKAFASDVAAAFNSIHVTGVGLDGVTGRALFNASGTALDPSVEGHPERLAAAPNATSLPAGNDIAILLARAGEGTLAGGGTMTGRFSELAGAVGTLRASARDDEVTRQDSLATAEAVRESASGVSTDEEMIRLQQFQRGFEASMRVLSTVNDLFDTLMRL